MADEESVIDREGRILARGDVTKEIGGSWDKRGIFARRPGRVEVVEGIYLRLSDGTVAGPMKEKRTNGDVFKFLGARVILPGEDDEAFVVPLGSVWLDSQGNAHSDPSPLDAVEVFDNRQVFW
jgi:hypothetical protein